MIEVVAMVYRSPAYAAMIRRELERTVPHFRIVANDPVHPLRWDGEVYHDPEPQDHYLARVYRCWNYCVASSKAEHVCLVNSDMVFSTGWLEALERRMDGRTLPVSRLVEPGIIRPGQHALEIDMGRDPDDFPLIPWERMASDLSEDRTEPGGLFMPCVFSREAFLRVGGYPEGNVGSVSGDAWLFKRLGDAGYSHVTCFDSLVYHFQEGEMRHVEMPEAMSNWGIA
jgi:hypothetical protein